MIILFVSNRPAGARPDKQVLIVWVEGRKWWVHEKGQGGRCWQIWCQTLVVNVEWRVNLLNFVAAQRCWHICHSLWIVLNNLWKYRVSQHIFFLHLLNRNSLVGLSFQFFLHFVFYSKRWKNGNPFNKRTLVIMMILTLLSFFWLRHFADVAQTHLWNVVLFLCVGLTLWGKSFFAQKPFSNFPEKRVLIGNSGGDFFLFYYQCFKPIFNHMLSPMIPKFFSNIAPPSAIEQNIIDNEFVFFVVPLSSEYKLSLPFFIRIQMIEPTLAALFSWAEKLVGWSLK